MPSLVTTKFKIHNAEQFIESLDETNATNLYLFVGRVEDWDSDGGDFDDTNPPAPTDSVANTNYDYWNAMIAAKKVTATDVSHVIRRINWESQTDYTAYTHTNSDIYANNFYVITDDFNVYKCLQNNLANGASTIKPTGTGTATIELSDGYKWKYMYTISSEEILRYTTSAYVPVKKIGATDDGSAQFDVEQAAIDGSLEIINKTSNGDFRIELTARPSNAQGDDQDFIVGEIITGQTTENKGVVISYTSDANNLVYFPNGNSLMTNTEVIVGETSGARGTLSQSVFSTYKFDEGTLAAVSNTTVMTLGASANNTSDSIYVNSTLFIKNNAARGEQSKISAYDASLRRVTLEHALTISPNTSSGYTISPTVQIDGDGDATVMGRTEGNTTHGVTGIFVTVKGSEYTTARTNVYANSSHGSGANGTVIISPPGGHGKNAVEELGGNRVMIDVRVSGNESGLFTTANDFRQVGLVRDPLQSANANAFFTAPLADQSVKLSLTDVTSFQEDETVKMPQIYQGNGLANSSANGVLIDLKNNVMRLNRIQGDFTSNSTVNTITGATSGGTATIITNGVSDPDMKPYSGDILYIENRKPVVRLDDQVEDFKIVLEF